MHKIQSEKIKELNEIRVSKDVSETQILVYRQGWEERFRLMALNGDDKLLDAEPFVLSDWESNEWIW